MTKVSREEFAEHCDMLDCNRFRDVWNKSYSVIMRKWYNADGLVGMIINWTTYYINGRM